MTSFFQPWQAFFRTAFGEYLRVLLLCSALAEFILLLDDHADYRWLTYLSCYSYGLLTHSAVLVAQKVFPQGSNFSRYLLPAVIAFMLASMLNLLIAGWLITGILHDYASELLTALVVFSVTVYWLFLIERDAQLNRRLQESELARLAKEKALIQSRLSLLQAQIEPHFLFNTMANLKASIELNPLQALCLVDHLTDLLRQSLKRSKDELLPLSDELHGCEAYLALQQIRLGGRLQFRIECTAEVNADTLLPPLLIQPLVENAVLHGVGQVEHACQVRLCLSMTTAQQLRIEVSDNGAGLGQSQHSGHGIGLDNIRQRLQFYFGPAATLQVSAQACQGVSSVLLLPLNKASFFSDNGVSHAHSGAVSG